MAQPVGLLVEAQALLAIGLAGNNWLDAAIAELLAQVVAVIGLVTEKLGGAFDTPDQALTNRIVVRLAAAQEDGEKAALSICDCVDLRVAPTARAANRLALRPPFPPPAERCAFMWVLSIRTSADGPPAAAKVTNNSCHTPFAAQRTNRL